MQDADMPAPTTLAGRQCRLEEQLRALRDPQARFGFLVERARTQPPLPDTLRLDVHRVAGCQVRLWLVPEFEDGCCRFCCDSDAVTLRAFVGALCELTDALPPAEVLRLDAAFLEELGLLRQLAESRRATILRVAEQIREFARLAPVPSAGA
jgi:cysteine desulfuration protein SufE